MVLIFKENVMLEKIANIDRIEVFENGCVQVRTKTTIMENGAPVTSTYNHHYINPGDSYAGEETRVKGICMAVHTSDVIAAYQAAQIPA
jgi:archaellum component FlaF (FlaF/FlaG flagellin family)